jgi:HlyD family secretion protein
VLLVLVTVAAAAVLRYSAFAAKPVAVKVARVERGSVEQTVSNTRAGTVKARRRARLSPETGGRVVELPHREGSRVERGDLLLRLEASVQQARLELAGEDVRAAEARAEEACLAADLAQSELRRFTELRASGIASDQLLDGLTSERDRGSAACRAVRATLDQAKARQRLARAELEQTELRAPFDGVVAEVNAELGEWISPSAAGFSTAVALDLLDPSSLYVTAPIDEMDAERVTEGQEVRLSVDSRRGEQFQGRLVRVAPYVLDLVEQNRTVEVEAELDDPRIAESLLPGTSADVEVILSRRQGVLQIPTSAIGKGGEVLVVAADGRLERRTVSVGLSNWRSTEVTAGLEEGELVVTSRSSSAVKAGDRVEIREDRPQGQAAPPESA